MMAQKKSKLPKEYQEVEYLESISGRRQWIDVGFPISDDLSMEITFATSENPSNGRYLMGNYAGNDGSFYLYLSRNVDHIYFQTAFGCEYSNTSVEADIQKHSFHYSFVGEETVVSESGVVVLRRQKYNPLKTDRNIRIVGSDTNSLIGCKTYSFVSYTGDNKVADFVPCYRKSDHKPGMYDLVTKEFFTNQGTGEFIVGADVN